MEILFLQLSAGVPRGEQAAAHTALLTLLPLRALHCEFMAELSFPRATFCPEGTCFRTGIPLTEADQEQVPASHPGGSRVNREVNSSNSGLSSPQREQPQKELCAACHSSHVYPSVHRSPEQVSGSPASPVLAQALMQLQENQPRMLTCPQLPW